MKLISLVFIFLFLFSLSTAVAGGGSDAGNGGGIAEKNMLFAYAELPHFIKLCLSTELCRTDTSENKLLAAILDSIDRERKVPLQFQSAQKQQNLFLIDGLIRVAKTGDDIGDPIYINQDLLYLRSKSGDSVAVDVPLATSILMHELGHHHGIKDHDALDRLGSKLQTLLLSHQEKSEFWNGNSALVVYQFNSVKRDEDKKNIASLDQLVLENDSELYNLTDLLVSKIRCPGGKAPVGVRIYNIYGMRGTRFNSKNSTITKPFQGWFIETCTQGAEYEHGDFRLDLTFDKIAPEKFKFMVTKTQVKVLNCKENSEVCK
jgi:hypothetical protein